MSELRLPFTLNKSNDFVFPMQDFNRNEILLLNFCAKKFMQSKKEGELITCPLSELQKFYPNTKQQNIRGLIQNAANGINSKPLKFKDHSTGIEEHIFWFDRIRYENSCIQFRFTRSVEHCFKPKKNFFQLEIEAADLYSCSYTQKLLELVKSRTYKTGQIVISLAEVREVLGVGNKYKLFQNFKDRVLNPCVADIEKFTPNRISYTPIKHGRAIGAIAFNFIPEKNQQKELLSKVKECWSIHGFKNPCKPIKNNLPLDKTNSKHKACIMCRKIYWKVS